MLNQDEQYLHLVICSTNDNALKAGRVQFWTKYASENIWAWLSWGQTRRPVPCYLKLAYIISVNGFNLTWTVSFMHPCIHVSIPHICYQHLYTPPISKTLLVLSLFNDNLPSHPTAPVSLTLFFTSLYPHSLSPFLQVPDLFTWIRNLREYWLHQRRWVPMSHVHLSASPLFLISVSGLWNTYLINLSPRVLVNSTYHNQVLIICILSAVVDVFQNTREMRQEAFMSSSKSDLYRCYLKKYEYNTHICEYEA